MNKEKEIAVSRLRERKNYIIEKAPEDKISNDEREYISSMLPNFDEHEAQKIKDMDKKVESAGGTKDADIIKMKTRRRPNVRRNIVIGSLTAVAAAGFLLLNVGNETNAGGGNGIWAFFGDRKEKLAGVVDTMDYDTYHYDSFDKLPPEKRKQVFKFTHESIPLVTIDLTLSDTDTNIISHYATDADNPDLFFSISLNIPDDHTLIRSQNYIFNNYEYDSSYKIENDDLYIYKSTNAEENERIEYLIMFFNGSIQCTVSGNLALYELQGIAAQYWEFEKS